MDDETAATQGTPQEPATVDYLATTDALKQFYEGLPANAVQVYERVRQDLLAIYVRGLRAAQRAVGRPDYCLKDWCEAVGVSYDTATSVMRLAEEQEEAATARKRSTRAPHTLASAAKPVSKWIHRIRQVAAPDGREVDVWERHLRLLVSKGKVEEVQAVGHLLAQATASLQSLLNTIQALEMKYQDAMQDAMQAGSDSAHGPNGNECLKAGVAAFQCQPEAKHAGSEQARTQAAATTSAA